MSNLQKKSYAEVVKGKHTTGNSEGEFEAGECEQTTGDSEAEFEAGEPVIKPSHQFFSYKKINSNPQKNDKQKSPKKRTAFERMQISLESELTPWEDIMDPLPSVSKDHTFSDEELPPLSGPPSKRLHRASGARKEKSATITRPFSPAICRPTSTITRPVTSNEKGENKTAVSISSGSPSSSPEKSYKIPLGIPENSQLSPISISSSASSPVSSPTKDISSINPTLNIRKRLDFENLSSDEDEFYLGDQTLPIFQKGLKSGVYTKDIFEHLINPTVKQLATRVPLSVNRNVLFLVDTSTLGHRKDILSDGCGVWVQTNTKTIFYRRNGNTIENISENTYGKDDTYKISRMSYRHADSEDFHRIIIFVKKIISGKEMDHTIAVAQYYFDKNEHTVPVRSHKNSKSDKPYFRTFQSTKLLIKDSAKTNPKNLVHKILEQKGGIKAIKAPGEHARGRKQVSNFKYSMKKCENDPLLELMDLCKTQSRNPSTAFIRQVVASPELKVFLSSDQQLRDIERFCTNPKNFSILGVDATYNVGDYYLTLTTYRNLMLTNKNGICPVYIGPALIHQRKLFDSYFTLPSLMLEYNQNLQRLLVYGSDGEKNITDAFDTCFNTASHLLCDIHFKDNIIKKLTDLGIKGPLAKEFLNDIFGKEVGDQKQAGLVDCFSKEEFDNKFEALRDPWASRHQSGEDFYLYFHTYKADLIKNSMTADLRAMAGLGYPPKMYTQNANECANSVIKRDLNFKKLDVKEGALHLQQIVQRQVEETRLAFVNRGELTVKEEYKEYSTPEEKYYQMSKSQKDNFERKFQTAQVKEKDAKSCDNAEQLQPNAELSVTPEQSQIINVPYRIVEDMFREAASLCSSDGNIVIAPGSQGKLHLVLSSHSFDTPHHVRVIGNSGQYSCDKNCLRWITYKVCSHTIATAEFEGKLSLFLKWYNGKSRVPNFAGLANVDMPAGRGKKAIRATQRRKGGNITNRNKGSCITQYKEPDFTLTNTSASTITVNPEPTVSVAMPKPHVGSYILTLLKFCHENTSKCYGCNSKFRDGGYPEPPNDLVVVTKGLREFRRDDGQKDSKLSNMYFHLNEKCIKKYNDFFLPCLLKVPDDVKGNLSNVHQHFLNEMHIHF